MSNIGKQLLLLRESKGLSQNQLANISKVPQSAISEIESGKRKNPGIIYFQQLSRALGVTLLELTSVDSPECVPETSKKSKTGACDFH
ncbi:HTH-type transcriptional repressor RghR [Sporomusa ovata DSM 2662]|uniref:helix-turn-helix domain-containing protein n=1 Tax=Sporomusa ovata TaxID=2378 RepID=UPI0003885645|nr:helix-turn-helix transcriptional regulator [Sporomusa ovata]EQB26654.1 putative transcriptional regulator [Sporomusa ovata DSM 2662]